MRAYSLLITLFFGVFSLTLAAETPAPGTPPANNGSNESNGSGNSGNTTNPPAEPEPPATLTCSPGKINGDSYGAFCANPTKKTFKIRAEVLCLRAIDRHVRSRTQEFTVAPNSEGRLAVSCGLGETVSEGHFYESQEVETGSGNNSSL